MGTPGVATTVSKKDLEDAIKKRRGVAAKVQDDLNIGHNLFYRLIEKFSLKELLNEERNAYKERLCDVAESVLLTGMLQTEDISSALSAAKYVLNNQGRDRGYYPPVPPPEKKETIIHDLRSGIREISSDEGSQANSKQTMAPQ